MSKLNRAAQCGIVIAIFLGATRVVAAEPEIQEIVVWGSSSDRGFANASPVTTLDPDDFRAINVTTTEDVVKFEPGVVIRRRFIGDANGVIGMRGSNMFQTSRTMVFADGVPLHYLLQSRWNGAPRWTMVSSSEIARVDVHYGPYSAEYSGNAMGGVVAIETAIPQQREIHFDSTLYSQSFDDYGFDDLVNGYKSFFSIGDKIGDTSLYFSLNRLENESQPQIFRSARDGRSENPLPVTGTIQGNDELGNPVNWYMDTGIVETRTNNYKFKLGHDFGNWSTLFNLAYEDRRVVSNVANTYLRDLDGNPVYGGHVVDDGHQFYVPATRFATSDLDRDSINAGLRVRGQLTKMIEMEANISRFEVLHDEDRASSTHPADPEHTLAGQVTTFNDTGWDTAEIKLTMNMGSFDEVELVTGIRHESYRLNLDIHDSANYLAGEKTTMTGSSGGETSIDAAFAQLNWQFNASWDAGFGLRYENFRSSRGYFDADDPASPSLDLIGVPSRKLDKLSPKFTLGYQIADYWKLRYSVAQAYRFPIVEELFSRFEAYNAISLADPGLDPEAGVHHNLMLERELDNGFMRVNAFTETVRDVIEAQSTILDGGASLRTFLPVDRIRTQGVEFIANIDALLLPSMGVRFNLVYTDSEILANKPDPAIVGNAYPRMPKWRGNLLASYNITPTWDLGINYQYATSSFGRIDNADHERRVYGAQDGYSRWGFTSGYRLKNGLALGVGIENITDQKAYVAHPWPGRTFFARVSYDL